MKLEVLKINHAHDSWINVKETLLVEKKYQEEIYRAVCVYSAAKRQGTSKVKTRAEVAGTSKKPWRQKGTGRARAGTKQSPIWRGGGVAFGPTGKNNYTKKQNRKAYQRAMKTVITQRLNEGNFICYSHFPIKKPQTKAFYKFFNDKGIISEKILLVTKEFNNLINLSVRNIPNITYKNINQINVYDMLNARKIVLDKLAFNALEEKWGNNV